MKEGDKWNWAFTTLGIMLLFIAANYPVLPSLGADKYGSAFVILVLSVWSGGQCLAMAALVSMFRRRSAPIVGALLGAALFCGVLMLFAVLLVLVVFLGKAIAPAAEIAAPCRGLAVLVFLILPLVCLGYALIRQPGDEELLQEPSPLSRDRRGHSEGAATRPTENQTRQRND